MMMKMIDSDDKKLTFSIVTTCHVPHSSTRIHPIDRSLCVCIVALIYTSEMHEQQAPIDGIGLYQDKHSTDIQKETLTKKTTWMVRW